MRCRGNSELCPNSIFIYIFRIFLRKGNPTVSFIHSDTVLIYYHRTLKSMLSTTLKSMLSTNLGDLVPGGICHGGFCHGNICHGGFCHRGFCHVVDPPKQMFYNFILFDKYLKTLRFGHKIDPMLKPDLYRIFKGDLKLRINN